MLVNVDLGCYNVIAYPTCTISSFLLVLVENIFILLASVLIMECKINSYKPCKYISHMHASRCWYGMNSDSDAEKLIFALPPRDGGLGFPIPTEPTAEQYRASSSITEPLVALCTGQNTEPLPNIYIAQEELKGEIRKHRREKQQETSTTLKNSLPATLQKTVDKLASEKEVSTWLTTLPIRAHAFSLHKQAF